MADSFQNRRLPSYMAEGKFMRVLPFALKAAKHRAIRTSEVSDSFRYDEGQLGRAASQVLTELARILRVEVRDNAFNPSLARAPLWFLFRASPRQIGLADIFRDAALRE